MSIISRTYIFDETDPELELRSGLETTVIIHGNQFPEVVKIFEQGIQGPPGPRGPQGYSGAGEPFYIITSGSLFATTSSLALFGSFSSSLVPWTGSSYNTTFDLGNIRQPWRNVYVSESIFIVKNGANLVTLRGSENVLEVGQSQISTSSFGFDNFKTINRISSVQQTYLFASQSVSSSFNEYGVFVLPDFQYLPTVAVGGLIKSGSDLFFGI